MTRDITDYLIAMGRKSYYMVLGVSRTESAHGIREAFRDLAKRYHPDRVGPARLRFFQEILEAYHILADPERRSQYDRGLYHAGAGGSPSAPAFAGAGAPGSLPQKTSVLRNLSIKDAPFEAALARVSGSLTGGEATKEFPEGLNAAVILSPEEARQGGLILVAVPSCSPCEGCGGSGREGLFPCSWCDGEGLLEEEETVRIHVPPGVNDATLMELPLRGLGVHNFYLRVNIRVAPERDRRRVSF